MAVRGTDRAPGPRYSEHPTALSAPTVASSALPAQAGVREWGQVVEQRRAPAGVLGRGVVVGCVLDALEQPDRGGLGGVEVSGFILRAFLYLRYKLWVLPPVAQPFSGMGGRQRSGGRFEEYRALVVGAHGAQHASVRTALRG